MGRDETSLIGVIPELARHRHKSGSVRVEGKQVRAGGEQFPVEWAVAVETAVALRYNGEDHAVVMASPDNLDDLALGYSLTEQLIGNMDEIHSISTERHPEGIVLNIHGPTINATRSARRFESRSSCGLCGVESLKAVKRELPGVSGDFELTADAVLRAINAMHDHQPLKTQNRSVHCAAWCTSAGEVLFGREDIGRHNALDKLIGAIHRNQLDVRQGFALLSSRCSFELVQKAACAGIPALACLSAPTALALELAEGAGMQLATRADNSVVYLHSSAPGSAP